MTAGKVSQGLTSIIVSTYNRPDALRCVLLELDPQGRDAFEVVVADDGSSRETAEMLAVLSERVGYRLKHVWQPDEGFRAARIRNLAVLEAEGDYLIFLDGDCIPLKGFVRGHRWLAEPGWWVRGTRVALRREFTHRILREGLSVAGWPLVRWVVASLQGEAGGPAPLARFRTQAFRKRRPRRWQGARTCNLAVWHHDFIAVDGFDESYTGWGREDTDLVVRLINAGVYRKEGRHAVPVVHLWHPGNPQSSLEANDALLAEVIERGAVRARTGLSAHLPPQAAG
ncbi:MAG: glycosyltransferase family 2 protein [Gemmatimonadales bacterium]|jgi:glycosyltransferase involved in cell wall biosynthesis